MTKIDRTAFIDYAGKMDLDGNDVEAETADKAVAEAQFDQLEAPGGGERRQAMQTLLDTGRVAQRHGDDTYAEAAFGFIIRNAAEATVETANRARWNESLVREKRGDLAGAIALMDELRAAGAFAGRRHELHTRYAQLNMNEVERQRAARELTIGYTVNDGRLAVELPRLKVLQGAVAGYADALRALRDPELVRSLDPTAADRFRDEAASELRRAASTYRVFVGEVQNLAVAHQALPWLRRMIKRHGEAKMRTHEGVENFLRAAEAPEMRGVEALVPLESQCAERGIDNTGYQLLWSEWLAQEDARGRALVPEDVAREAAERLGNTAWDLAHTPNDELAGAIIVLRQSLGIPIDAPFDASIDRIANAVRP